MSIHTPPSGYEDKGPQQSMPFTIPTWKSQGNSHKKHWFAQFFEMKSDIYRLNMIAIYYLFGRSGMDVG